MKKLASMFIAVILMTGVFAACSGGDNGNKPKPSQTQVLNIFISSSQISAKSDDAYVKKIVEDKFYEDRGIKIDLQVQVYNETDFNTTMANRMAGSSWDAAVGYIGQAGIDEIMISQGVVMEIGGLLKTYDNVYGFVKDNLDAVTTIDNSVYGVPTREITNRYGVLARKDYMDKVGYTIEPGHNDNLGAINEDPAGRKKTLVTIDDFTDMMRRMKAQGVCDYPLSGYPWDLEYTLTVGPFSSASYMTKTVEYDQNGKVTKVLPGQLSPDYLKTLRYEYLWASEGLWEPEAYTGQKINKTSAFVNGTTGIYCVDPDIINLISVARQVKKNNASAEFVILEPLYGVDDAGNKTDTRGNYKKQESSGTLVINKRSDKAEVILEYLDWLAEDVDNYNLATYGVEGEHFIKSGEGRYTYPANRKASFELNPPYSGMYGLVKWEKHSYMIYDSYTEQEFAWVEQVRNFPTFTNPCDNMLFIGTDTDTALNHQTAENDFFQDCLVKVWEGILDPDLSFNQSAAKYKNTAATYITWLTAEYNKYIIARG